jgi:CubicO group peptidase (beta-lactamase class C family)
MKRVIISIPILNMKQLLKLIVFYIALLSIACNAKHTSAVTNEGMSGERLKISRELLQKAIDNKVAGSAVGLIARNGKIVFRESFGEAGPGIKMNTDAIVRMASIGKTVTAATVLTLYENGKIQLSDPIEKYIPEFKETKVQITKANGKTELVAPEKSITVYDLLTHRAGFSGGGQGVGIDELWDKAKTVREFASLLAQIPLVSQPGIQFEYGPSYEVLAAITEVVSGMNFKEYTQKAILEPLRMNDTYFFVPDEKKQRLAAQYKKDSLDNLIIYRNRGQEEQPSQFYAGGGGLRSTVDDFFRFTQMLLNNGELDGTRILSPKTVQLMTANHLKNEAFGETYGWGLGTSVKLSLADKELGTIGSYGWNGGTGTQYVVDPKEKLIVIIFVPSVPRTPGVNELRDAFIATAYQAIENSNVQ